MSKQMKSAEELNRAISEILQNIEQLNKSYTPGAKMQKAEGDYEGEEGYGDDPSQSPEMSEGGDMPAEQPAEGEGMGEGEGEGDEMGVEEYLAQMADEELQSLLAAAQAELEGRAAPAEGDEAAMGGDEAPLQKSVKQLQSKISQLNEKIDKLEKSNSSTKKAVAAAKKGTSKVASSNNLQVLEKSNQQKPVERLSKSDTLSYLQGQIRKNPDISSRMVWQCNKIPEGDENALSEFQDTLRKKGIELPKP